MDEPRLVELASFRVVKRRYEGPRPPAPDFFAHWRAFHRWAELAGIESAVPDIVMIGYEPPGQASGQRFIYDACIPVADDFELPLSGLETVDQTPGGRFALCRGDLSELPNLYREARRYAVARGLPFERGGIEIYHPHPSNPDSFLVEAGSRIHD